MHLYNSSSCVLLIRIISDLYFFPAVPRNIHALHLSHYTKIYVVRLNNAVNVVRYCQICLKQFNDIMMNTLIRQTFFWISQYFRHNILLLLNFHMGIGQFYISRIWKQFQVKYQNLTNLTSLNALTPQEVNKASSIFHWWRPTWKRALSPKVPIFKCQKMAKMVCFVRFAILGGS